MGELGWGKTLHFCVLKSRGKENSLVLFYVVCVQLEEWGTRGREGLKISYE